jgi:hypothetical protein
LQSRCHFSLWIFSQSFKIQNKIFWLKHLYIKSHFRLPWYRWGVSQFYLRFNIKKYRFLNPLHCWCNKRPWHHAYQRIGFGKHILQHDNRIKVQLNFL